jgi:hypothetical protein
MCHCIIRDSLVLASTLLNTNPLTILIIVAGVYAYLRYVRAGGAVSLIGLLCCGIVGPLVREGAIVLPVTVLGSMVVERVQDRRLWLVVPLMLAHAVFPSTLPNLFLGNMVSIPVFGRGYVSQHVGLGFFSTLRLDTSAHLIAIVPPLITSLTVAAIVLHLSTIRIALAPRIGLAVLVAVGFLALFVQPVVDTLPTLLCVGVANATWQHSKLLPIWFFAAWVPWLRLYNSVDTALVELMSRGVEIRSRGGTLPPLR